MYAGAPCYFAEGRVPLKSPPGMRTQTTKEKTMKDIALFVVGMFLITTITNMISGH